MIFFNHCSLTKLWKTIELKQELASIEIHRGALHGYQLVLQTHGYREVGRRRIECTLRWQQLWARTREFFQSEMQNTCVDIATPSKGVYSW